MVNINGKEWNEVILTDIEALIADIDFDESFFFEFKADDVSPKKITEEISAFANTYGGYILLGISNDKRIKGCKIWNEQRIHTTIHDSITPTPSFDIKKLTCDEGAIFVIKIDEGSEPPYITNTGKIFERLSSGSFVVKDSNRLSQIYIKRENLLAKMEQKISIPHLARDAGNIYGYIDLGFIFVATDNQTPLDTFNKADLRAIAKKLSLKTESYNLACVGNSIVYTPGGLSIERGFLPAHTSNFIEIMADGSAKMRILLHNNNPDDSEVNMSYPSTMLHLFKEVYWDIMGELLPEKMAYAKKYEALTVRKQFQPVLYYDDIILEEAPELKEKNEKLLSALKEKRELMGIDTIVTDDRIPKTGLYTIDKRNMEKWGVEYTANAILDELFFSRFMTIGLADT